MDKNNNNNNYSKNEKKDYGLIFLGLLIIAFGILVTGYNPNTTQGFNETLGVNNNSLNVNIVDPLNNKGFVKVLVEEKTSDIIDYYLRRTIQDLSFNGTQTLGSYDIKVLDTSGVSTNNIIRVQEGSRLFQANIISINGNTITTNIPLDYPYTSNADISEASIDLNVDGSVTPVIFSLEPTQQSIWHINRFICGMVHNGAGDDSKFGDLPALDRGVIFRQTNGIQHTFFSARTNGELRIRMFDLDYSDKAGGGDYSTFFRRTFGGQDKNGAVIELDPFQNESFEIVIQDDLTSLNKFNCVIQGHIEED